MTFTPHPHPLPLKGRGNFRGFPVGFRQPGGIGPKPLMKVDTQASPYMEIHSVHLVQTPTKTS